MHDEHERIRRRAYELWERDGRSGDAEEHWFRAEQELKRETTEEATRRESSPGRSPEAQKFADQVEVATKSRNARSRQTGKQTGRAGATGVKKKAARARPESES